MTRLIAVNRNLNLSLWEELEVPVPVAVAARAAAAGLVVQGRAVATLLMVTTPVSSIAQPQHLLFNMRPVFAQHGNCKAALAVILSFPQGPNPSPHSSTINPTDTGDNCCASFAV
jgi:hypothetical protein